MFREVILEPAHLLPSLAVHLVQRSVVEERVELEEPLPCRPATSSAAPLELPVVVFAISPNIVGVSTICATAISPRRGRGQRAILPVFFAW